MAKTAKIVSFTAQILQEQEVGHALPLADVSYDFSNYFFFQNVNKLEAIIF